MTDVPIPATDQAVLLPRRLSDLPEAASSEKYQLAREWLQRQELAMAQVFLEEGRRELPVDGEYADWRQAQQRRLGEARERWMRTLADAGGNSVGTSGRSLAYLRPIFWMSTTFSTPRIRPIYRSLGR